LKGRRNTDRHAKGERETKQERRKMSLPESVCVCYILPVFISTESTHGVDTYGTISLLLLYICRSTVIPLKARKKKNIEGERIYMRLTVPMSE
jgi:hypothetical protein